ncbi:MAG: hypothetical protein K2K31_01105 [Clostridia bacterium]|nr:hypothetical protein [Clostridia bacterium]
MSCCGNHPCQIFCPFSLDCTGNQVINPVFEEDFGFFNNTTPTVAVSQGVIGVNTAIIRGGTISSTAQSVKLDAGIYEVTYLAGGVVTSDNISIKLTLNGVDVAGSVLQTTDDMGEVENLTQKIMLIVPSTSTLSLVNNTDESVNFLYASIVIRRT